MQIVISGIQPTNKLTLGNYAGAIKDIIKYQDEYKLYAFVADLHALSNPAVDNKDLWENKQKLVASYVACGVDLNKTILFFQSDVHTHDELMWILTCQTTFGELSRMTQFKDKTSKLTASNGTEYIPNGLFLYPVLMAADILLYDSNYVYVGQDQKQHVELTRNIAERFNNKFGQTFTLPEPLIPSNGNRIMDLLDPIHKMSKSAKNENGTIFLLDKPAVATKKIMGALTDNLNRVKYDYKTQPGITNLITIYSVCSNLSIKEIEDKYQVIENYGSFKKDLANIVSSFLIDFQAKYNESIKNIDNVLVQVKNNANKCLEITEKKLAEVYSKVGLIK